MPEIENSSSEFRPLLWATGSVHKIGAAFANHLLQGASLLAPVLWKLSLKVFLKAHGTTHGNMMSIELFLFSIARVHISVQRSG
jgi:hypothetical protein